MITLYIFVLIHKLIQFIYKWFLCILYIYDCVVKVLFSCFSTVYLELFILNYLSWTITLYILAYIILYARQPCILMHLLCMLDRKISWECESGRKRVRWETESSSWVRAQLSTVALEDEKKEYVLRQKGRSPRIFLLFLLLDLPTTLRARTCRIDSPRLVYKLFCEWHFANCRVLSRLFVNPRRRDRNASCFIARLF